MTSVPRAPLFCLALSWALGCGGRTDEQQSSDAHGALSVAGVPPSTPPRSTPPRYVSSSPPFESPTPTSSAPTSTPLVGTEAPPSGPAPDAGTPSEPPRPSPAPAPLSDPCFAYLGDWITCENSGWPNAQKKDATDLHACMQACLQQSDCSAVIEYFWMDRPDLGCWLYTSTCNTPAGGPWQEEDGGRMYRRTCSNP